jgi:hypothetical protein
MSVLAKFVIRLWVFGETQALTRHVLGLRFRSTKWYVVFDFVDDRSRRFTCQQGSSLSVRSG